MVVLFIYYFFLLFFLYILSLVFGLGALFFMFSRGVFLGVIFFMIKETPLSFFLVSPFGVVENILLIIAGSVGLNLGREAVKLLRGDVVNKENFVLTAQLLALMIPLFIASYFLDNFLVDLIFNL